MPPVRRLPGAEYTRAASRFVLFLSVFAFFLGAARLARADPPTAPVAPALPAPTARASDAAPLDAPEEVQVRGALSRQASASEISVGQGELAMRPRLRAEDVIESVPGLFTMQHSGGAKAQQYFLRGFDADHGTDIAFFADGIPLNAVSHAHGQGYTDLHFLIPELVLGVDATKGPFSPRFGDFATAGAVDLRMVDRLSESLGQLEIGPGSRARGLAAESPDLGDRWRAVAAVEIFRDDGYFIHPEAHQRVNVFTRLTHTLNDDSELSVTLMGYGATWNASGTIPARAVCGEGDANRAPQAYGAHCISRFDSIDPSQGGGSERTSVSLAYRLRLNDLDISANAYAIRSGFRLFVDDTLFADDPVHGDAIEQDDNRSEVGARVLMTNRARVAGLELDTTVGLEGRVDAIDNALHHQRLRQRLDTQISSRIRETELGAFVEEAYRTAHWLRFVLGARADRIDAAVDDLGPTVAVRAAGAQGGGLLSPKAMAIVSPARQMDLFFDYGRGFHSNDARGVVSEGATLLAVATGYELGVRARPIRGLILSAAAFLLDVTSELIFDGNTATTAPSGPTRREGLELTARYRFGTNLFADASLTVTRARFRNGNGPGPFVPLAPTRTFSAGIGARRAVGVVSLFGALRVQSIADRPATPDGALFAQGFTLVNAQAGARWMNVEAAVDIFNAFNEVWREGQFAITSRLPYEPRPVTAMSFTPGRPRELMGRIAIFW